MKNLFYSLIALCSLTLSAQEKTFSFDKKVSYEIKIPEGYEMFIMPDMLNLNFYIGKDALLGNSDGDSSFTGFKTSAFFTTNNRFFDVTTNSLENVLKIKSPSYYGEDYDSNNYQAYSENFFDKNGKLYKLNTTNTINGYSCNNYEYQTIEEDSIRKTIICIDEKNSINNAKFLLPKQNVNGLIVSASEQDTKFGFFIKKVQDSKLNVEFDEKKSIEIYNEELAKSKSEYEQMYSGVDSITSAIEDYTYDNSYEDPIYLYSSYATSENENVNNVFNTIASLSYSILNQDNDYNGVKDFERSKAIKVSEESSKQVVKQFRKNGLINNSEAIEINKFFKELYKDAKEFKLTHSTVTSDDISSAVDEIAADLADEAYIESYSSNYKTMDINSVELAIEQTDSEYFKNIAPNYCKDLKNNIPAFTDKSLKNLVHNYAGQICDLYIYNSGFVDLESTLDALRKSVWEVSKKYDSMSKSDQEKLKSFLDTLD